jgi:hypothetical protein
VHDLNASGRPVTPRALLEGPDRLKRALKLTKCSGHLARLKRPPGARSETCAVVAAGCSASAGLYCAQGLNVSEHGELRRATAVLPAVPRARIAASTYGSTGQLPGGMVAGRVGIAP